MNLSKNFTLYELTKSQTALRRGINNTPTPEHTNNLRTLAEHVLQPIRDHFKRPVVVNSGYRGPELNRAIGGALNSQHMTGHAADIEIMSVSNYSLARWIELNLDFDQLILEMYDPTSGDPNSGWVHVSYVSPERNRRQVLTYLTSRQFVNGLVR